MSKVPRPLPSKTKLTPGALKRSQHSSKQPHRGLSEINMMKKTIDEFARSTSLNPSHLQRLQKIKTNYLIAKRERGRSTGSPTRNTGSLKKRSEQTSRDTSQEDQSYRTEDAIIPTSMPQTKENSADQQIEETLEKEDRVKQTHRVLSIEEMEEKLIGERNKGIKWRIEKSRSTRREGGSMATTRATSFSSQTELPSLPPSYNAWQNGERTQPVYLGMDTELEWVQKIREGMSLRQMEVQGLKAQLPDCYSQTHSRNQNKFLRRGKHSQFTSVAPSTASTRSKRATQFKLFNFNKSSIRNQKESSSFYSTESSKPLLGVLYKSIGFTKLEPDTRQPKVSGPDSTVDLKPMRRQHILQQNRNREKQEGAPSGALQYLLTNAEEIRNILANEFHQQIPEMNATRKVVGSRRYKGVNKGFIGFVRPECFTKQVLREKLWKEEKQP